MSWEAAKFLLEFVALVGAFLAWFYAWQAARAKASRADVDTLRDDHGTRITQHGERITRVEAKLEAMPNRNDIDALLNKIGDVGDDVSAIGATVRALDKQVGLLNQYHMNGGGR